MTLARLATTVNNVAQEVCGVTMRSLRSVRGWSQKRMAMRVGLPVERWALFEEGELAIPMRQVWRAVSVFVGETEPGLPRTHLPWPTDGVVSLRNEALQRLVGRILALVVR